VDYSNLLKNADIALQLYVSSGPPVATATLNENLCEPW